MNLKNISEQFGVPNSLIDLDCSDFVKRKFIFLKNNNSIPNLLITGPPGSGKSTAGKWFYFTDYIIILFF